MSLPFYKKTERKYICFITKRTRMAQKKEITGVFKPIKSTDNMIYWMSTGRVGLGWVGQWSDGGHTKEQMRWLQAQGFLSPPAAAPLLLFFMHFCQVVAAYIWCDCIDYKCIITNKMISCHRGLLPVQSWWQGTYLLITPKLIQEKIHLNLLYFFTPRTGSLTKVIWWWEGTHGKRMERDYSRLTHIRCLS